MKKFLLWTLLFCIAGASSCDLLEKENDQGDDGPITTPDDRPFLSIELERLRTLVLPDDEVRIGFTVRTGNIPEQTEEEPLDIVYEAWTSDESVYEAEVLTDGDRAGALVVRGIGGAAGRIPGEVVLRAANDRTAQEVVVTLEELSCTLAGAPAENTYIAPSEGGTLEIVIESNAMRPLPLTVNEEWIGYDSAETQIESDEEAGFSRQRHTLRLEPHTEGSSAREGSVVLLAADGFALLEFVVRQEVDFAADGREMVLRVRASAGNARTVHLPLLDVDNCTVDWGDGTIERYEHYDGYANAIHHTYETAGEYAVTIRGRVPRISVFAMPQAAQTNCILAVEKWGNLGAEEIILRDLTSLERIAADTDGAFSLIEVFDRTFLGCTGLTELPAGLFAHAAAAVTFEATFYECTGLRSLPDGLFEGADPKTFDTVFARCTGLKELPADLFRGCRSADLFHRTFEECTGLTHLPADLFAPCTEASRFKATFYGCTGLTELPAGLFAHNSEVDSFGGETIYYEGTSYKEEKGLFAGCTALRSIPETLFAGNPQAEDFSMAFLGCKSLTRIPAGFFDANSELEDLTSTFEGCTALETIPEGLFDRNEKLSDLTDAFAGCESLRTIPAGLFDRNRLILSFFRTFAGCSALEGESPATEIGDRIYHLYERAENPVEFTVPDGRYCYAGCTGLTDYDRIPEEWK